MNLEEDFDILNSLELSGLPESSVESSGGLFWRLSRIIQKDHQNTATINPESKRYWSSKTNTSAAQSMENLLVNDIYSLLVG